jgi:hypothetical protein
MKRLRLIDLSMYYWIKSILHAEEVNTLDVGSQADIFRTELPYYVKVMDAYPDPQKEEFTLPTIVISHEDSNEEGLQIGGGYRDFRMFNVDVFGSSEGERDDLTEIIYEGLDRDSQVRNFNTAFPHYVYDATLGILKEEFVPGPVPAAISDLIVEKKTTRTISRTSPFEISSHRALIRVQTLSLR